MLLKEITFNENNADAILFTRQCFDVTELRTNSFLKQEKCVCLLNNGRSGYNTACFLRPRKQLFI